MVGLAASLRPALCRPDTGTKRPIHPRVGQPVPTLPHLGERLASSPRWRFLVPWLVNDWSSVG